jgi:4a-hydroxytetrahydrobiopterin dehydratase
MTGKLSASEVKDKLSAIPGWVIADNGELTRTYKRKNFMDGLKFVNELAVVAEKAGHHPDVLLTYPSVKISLTTHDAGGLTEKDFALAAAIDSLQ